MKKKTGLIYVFPIIFILIFTLNACQPFSANFSSPVSSSKPHPLIDEIWSVSEQQFIHTDTLNKRILENNIILLGETHDNTRHHQLQAQVIAHLTANNHFPAVAYEMLNQNQQTTINNFQTKYYPPTAERANTNTSTVVDTFAKVINWEESGWPEWDYYRPVFYNTIENKLPIIAANLDIKKIRKVIKQGSNVLDQSYQDLLVTYQYDESLKKELKKEILAAHCDMLPEKMLSPMLLGQQVRDLAMTQAILASLPGKSGKVDRDNIVLIAGSGHTRTDYAIPYYLHQEAPELKIMSLTFMEVSEGEFSPKEYVKAWSDSARQLPFDYVWFTPKAEREDQCEKMKAYMKKKKG